MELITIAEMLANGNKYLTELKKLTIMGCLRS